MGNKPLQVAKEYRDGMAPIPITSPENPNTILPCFRHNNKSLSMRIASDQEVCKSHFVFRKIVGKGQFGFVWKVFKLPEHIDYALKVMDKTQIYNKRCVDTVMNELALLRELMHPFLVNIKYAFQERNTLYLATEYLPGGDLGYYLHQMKKEFTEKQVQFFVASIILALEFLHNNGVIHRDIRPENLVFDA